MVLRCFLPSRTKQSHNTWTTTRVSAQGYDALAPAHATRNPDGASITTPIAGEAAGRARAKARTRPLITPLTRACDSTTRFLRSAVR
jgi:hypothetical protein